MSKILLFDVDGTICESGQPIKQDMVDILLTVRKQGYKLGIVGGGGYEKLTKQMGENKYLFTYFFTECGSVLYIDDKIIYKKNIREHSTYPLIVKLIGISLEFIKGFTSDFNKDFIDIRNGLVYISLVDLKADLETRRDFMIRDKTNKYRERLFNLLMDKNTSPDLEITYGGQVGIGLYPKEWSKAQAIDYFDNKTEIHFFGDRYEINGNDYHIITHKRVIGHPVTSLQDTINELKKLISDKSIKI